MDEEKAGFTEDQIIAVVREHEAGAKAADLARKHWISEAMLYNWKAKYGGMDVSDSKRLRRSRRSAKPRSCSLTRCRKSRCASCCQKNGTARRQARGSRHLQAAIACRSGGPVQILSADRKMIRYRSRRPPSMGCAAGWELANERRRFVYRRLFILLRREGEPSGINRIYLLSREEGLTVRKRRSRRRAVGTRAPILVEARPNARWSLDFVQDQFACGRRFRVLNILDDVTRQCLAAIPDTQSRAAKLRAN